MVRVRGRETRKERGGRGEGRGGGEERREEERKWEKKGGERAERKSLTADWFGS